MNAVIPLSRPDVPTGRTSPFRAIPAVGIATEEDPPILHAAVALAEQIRDAGDEIEQGRRIPPAIAAAMKDAGVFGMAMPHAWGGPELDPLTQFRVIEALAMAEGSVGWCAMIGCDGGYVAAFLDQDIGRAMYPDLRVPPPSRLRRRVRRNGCRAAIASAAAFRSSVVASIANGPGLAASSFKTVCR